MSVAEFQLMAAVLGKGQAAPKFGTRCDFLPTTPGPLSLCPGMDPVVARVEPQEGLKNSYRVALAQNVN